jgi:hypothetical protein
VVERDFRHCSEMRVMSDPESIITSVGSWSRVPMEATVLVAAVPRKEHPGGRARYFHSSKSGLESRGSGLM